MTSDDGEKGRLVLPVFSPYSLDMDEWEIIVMGERERIVMHLHVADRRE